MTADEVLQVVSNAVERQASVRTQLEKYGIPVTDEFTSEMRERFNEEMANLLQSSQHAEYQWQSLQVAEFHC
jgi:hypothetical protein